MKDKMKKHLFPTIIAVSFGIMGMVGLSMEIPHTGWLLAASVLMVFFHDWD